MQEEGQPLKSNPETKQKEKESIINNKNPNVPPKTQIVIKGGRNTSVTSNIDSLKDKVNSLNFLYKTMHFSKRLQLNVYN